MQNPHLYPRILEIHIRYTSIIFIHLLSPFIYRLDYTNTIPKPDIVAYAKTIDCSL